MKKLRKGFSKLSEYIPQILLLMSVLTSNIFAPAAAIAQELSTDVNEVVVNIPVDESEDILDEGISTSIFEEGIYTVDIVVEREEYVYPDNTDVRIIFSEVTEEGNLVIKKVELTDEEKELLNTSDDYGWDISSTMSDGSFTYALTLPNTQGDDIEVKYTEDGSDYESIEDISVESNVVVIERLDHFTTFIVVNPLPGGYTEGAPDCPIMAGSVCYDTIQEAIDAANTSDEIYVDSSYDSSLETFPIEVDEEVKIYGIQAGVDPRPSTGGRTGVETVIDGEGLQVFEIDADNVEINGFEITNGGDYMIEQVGSHSNYVFQYNIVYDQNGDDALKVRTCTDCSVNNNYIYNVAYPGDAIGVAGATNCIVDNNEITNDSSDNAAIYVYSSTNTTITNNLIYDIPVGEGIKLGNKSGGDAHGTGGTISGNIVYDIGDPLDGGDNNDDGIAVYMSNVLVDGNEIYNDYSENGALYLAFDVSNITITNNYIHNNDLETIKLAGGITLNDDVNASTVYINDNEIVDNTPYGVINRSTTLVVNAQSNWWGDGTGPDDTLSGDGSIPDTNTGLGNSVRGAVDYSNWITSMDNTPPSIPILESPIGGVYINDNTPLMQWADSTDDDSSVAGYYYRIYYNCSDVNNPSTCSTVYPNVTGLWRTDSEYQAGTTPDGTYYWQVMAEDSVGNQSAWSDLEKMTIDTQVPDKLEFVFPDPNIPVHYFDYKPILNDWTDSSDENLDSYEVKYVRDSDGVEIYRTVVGNSQRNHTPSDSNQTGFTVYVRAIDKAGNIGAWSNPVYYIYDATNPTIPTNLSFETTTGDILGCSNATNEYTIVATWDASIDDSPITYEYRSYNPTTGWIWNAGNIGDVTQRQGSFTVGEGVYGFAVRAVDEAGNYSDWTSVNLAGSCQITYDTTAPLVSDITITKGGNPVTYIREGDEITITATVVDELTSVKAVSADFSYNSGYSNRPTPKNTPMYHATGDTYEATFTIPSGWNEGDLYITVAARDILDNYDGNRSLAQILIIDNTKPKSKFTTNLNGTYHNSSILVEGVSTDNNNVEKVGLYYRERGTSNWEKFNVVKNDTGLLPFNWSVDWKPPHDGIYDIKAEAVDIAGNQEQSPTMYNITYDTSAPKISNAKITIDYLSKYVNGYTGFLISASVKDSLSGINKSSCEYTIDGGFLWKSGYYAVGKCYFTVSSGQLYDTQDLRIGVAVKDRASNERALKVGERQVDKKLPRSQTQIADEYYGPNKLPIIRGIASDTVSQITDVKVTVQRSSDNKYMTPWGSWSYLPYKLDTIGTNHWVFNTNITHKQNRVTYTVTPYAWDEVHLISSPGKADFFIWDSQDPRDPTHVHSTSHDIGDPSQTTQITINFSGAHDYGLSGVMGYFYSFSKENPEIPPITPFNFIPYGTNTITSPILSDGTWYFNIRTVDNVRNITSTVHVGGYIIDTTPAVITWNAPADGSIHNSAVVLSASTNEMMNNLRFKWQLDGESWNPGQNLNYQDTTYNYTFDPVEDGIYHLRAQGRDLALNWSKADDITITIDRIAPEVEITNPLNDSLVKGVIDIYGSVEDINPDHYYLVIKNSLGEVVAGPGTVYRYDSFTNELLYTWNTASVPDGEYMIHLAARDAAGNRDDSVSLHQIYVIVDNTAPDISLELPINGDTYAGVIDLQALCNEDCDYINFWWREESQSYSNTVEDRRYHYIYDDGTLFEWSLDSLNAERWGGDLSYVMTDGTYYFYAAGKDLAGNWARSDEIMIIVDNTPPIIGDHDDMILVEGDTFPTDTVTLTDNYGFGKVYAQATDLTGTMGSSGYMNADVDTSNLTGDQFALADEIRKAIEDWQGSPFTTIDLSILPEGQYFIEYYAVDLAGNESTRQSFTVTIQDNVPTVVASATSTEAIEGDPAITLSATVTNGNAPFTYLWSDDCTGTGVETTFDPTTAGIYTCTVTVTDSDGDTAEDTIQITVTAEEEGEVAGAADEAGGTGNNNGVNGTEDNGTGSGEEIEEEAEEILGEETETCDNPITVKGYLFYDRNKNDEMDEKEKGVEGVSIRIYYIDKNDEEVTLDYIETDENGYWETQLCVGDYYIEIDQDTLPKNLNTEEVLSLQITGDDTDTIEFNIAAIDIRTFWQKYWYLILIGAALLLTIVYAILRRGKKEQYQ